jgi:hypothetical protein
MGLKENRDFFQSIFGQIGVGVDNPDDSIGVLRIDPV